jgi:sn-glycerol 3-phosphate transport system substrate-binding protein
MNMKTLAATIAAAMLCASQAHAQIEIQWWHSMTGALNDKVNEIANGFNATHTD